MALPLKAVIIWIAHLKWASKRNFMCYIKWTKNGKTEILSLKLYCGLRYLSEFCVCLVYESDGSSFNWNIITPLKASEMKLRECPISMFFLCWGKYLWNQEEASRGTGAQTCVYKEERNK